MVRSVLLMCVLIHLMQGVYLVRCPRYFKYEAIEQGRLSNNAACRAMQYDYYDKICLDGFKHSGFYCATGSCNMFGYECDGYCLTGDDSTNRDKHNFSSKCSNVTALSELDKLCQVYNRELILRKYGQIDKYGEGWGEVYIEINPLDTVAKTVKDYFIGKNIEDMEDNIKHVCTVTLKNYS